MTTEVVYVATTPARVGVKIGFSSNHHLRLKALAYESGAPVEFQHIESGCGEAVERAAHWLARDKHLGGEWFDITAVEAAAYIIDARAKVAEGFSPPRRVATAKPFAELKDVRLQILLSPEHLEALDDWRASQRIWSRSEAIRQLIAAGVARDA